MARSTKRPTCKNRAFFSQLGKKYRPYWEKIFPQLGKNKA